MFVTIDSAEQRRAEALQRASGDELRLARRQPAEQRGQREQDEADHEQPAPSEQVGHPPAEQQKAAERQRVGVGNPREVLLGEPQVLSDRRDRHVDDRGVEDDHELRAGQQGQREPFASLGRFGIGHRWYSNSARVNMKIGSA